MDNTTPDTVVVPVEPTEAMLDAWHEAVAKGIFGENGDGGKPHPEYMRDAYRAMLAARPAATPGGEREAIARVIEPAAFETVPDGRWVYPDDIRAAPLAKADAILAALSRPAPVAGEAVAWRYRLIDARGPCMWKLAYSEQEACASWPNLEREVQPLYATPTPQPAAARGGEDYTGLVNAATDDLRILPHWHEGLTEDQKRDIDAAFQNGVEMASEAILSALSAKGGS